MLSLCLNLFELILKVTLLCLPDSFSFNLDRSEVHISKPYVVVSRLIQILVLGGNYSTTQNSTTSFELIVNRVQVATKATEHMHGFRGSFMVRWLL